MVKGSAGADLINAGKGNDTVSGGAGQDRFVFDTALDKYSNVDRILDFKAIDDTILLDDAVFKKVGALGVLSAGAFVTGSKALDASDRIIYNAATGDLLYDADGSGKGAAIQLPSLAPIWSLTNADFVIVQLRTAAVPSVRRPTRDRHMATLSNPATAGERSPVARAIAHCRGALASVLGFSVLTNLLMLAGPLFMLQVYDRVLVSGSFPWPALSCCWCWPTCSRGCLTVLRGRIMVRAAEVVDAGSLARCSGRSFGKEPAAVRRFASLTSCEALSQGQRPAGPVQSAVPSDFPGVVLAFVHPLIGTVALIGGGVVARCRRIVRTRWASGRRNPRRPKARQARRAGGLARRNGGLITAMGMRGAFARRLSAITMGSSRPPGVRPT
ncbi:MAG: hypothetical protein IPK28_10605 [Devosia sp.]|nr:hypothetical protein [Devosia sp.]